MERHGGGAAHWPGIERPPAGWVAVGMKLDDGMRSRLVKFKSGQHQGLYFQRV